jgi:hypothetical protein
MAIFTPKESTVERIHASYSRKALDIRGTWYMSGPQPVGVDGGAPQWVWDLFEQDETIQTVTVGRADYGVVYARMTPQPPAGQED